MEYKKCDVLEQKMCKELELLEQKYQNSPAEMSIQDLDKIDKLYHALKSMATYNAMKEAEEYGEEGWSSNSNNAGGNSGYRGRAMNGRFVSRSNGNSYSEGYANGYSNGYSEASEQMNNSGHYPMMPYAPRRW